MVLSKYIFGIFTNDKILDDTFHSNLTTKEYEKHRLIVMKIVEK